MLIMLATAVLAIENKSTCFHRIRTSVEDQIIDIFMKSISRKASKVLHGCPVIVNAVRVLSKFVIVAHGFPTKNAGTSSMQPESWLLFRVAGCKAFGNSLRSRLVIRGIGCVCVM